MIAAITSSCQDLSQCDLLLKKLFKLLSFFCTIIYSNKRVISKPIILLVERITLIYIQFEMILKDGSSFLSFDIWCFAPFATCSKSRSEKWLEISGYIKLIELFYLALNSAEVSWQATSPSSLHSRNLSCVLDITVFFRSYLEVQNQFLSCPSGQALERYLNIFSI